MTMAWSIGWCRAPKMVSMWSAGRDMPKEGNRFGSLIKKTLSRMAGLSLRYMAGIPTSDVTNSFKLYRKEIVDALTIESDGGFEIGMEIVIKAHFSGHKVTEIPCTWRDRQQGASRFRVLHWLPKYMKWYLFAMKKRVG